MKLLDFRKEALPLYVQLKNIIKDDIEQGVYKNGDIIPAEIEYQKQYDVSRITVRQAIASLEKERYVERARGKGTKVIYKKSIEEKLQKIRSFTEEMKDQNIEPGTLSVQVGYEAVEQDILDLFDVDTHQQLLCLRRVRSGNGEPIVYFVTYFSPKFNMPLDAEEYKHSMYELFEKMNIHKPTRVVENIKSMNANSLIAEKLNIEINMAVLVRTRISYNQLNDVIEYTISYYRGDRYSYSIELNS